MPHSCKKKINNIFFGEKLEIFRKKDLFWWEFREATMFSFLVVKKEKKLASPGASPLEENWVRKAPHEDACLLVDLIVSLVWFRLLSLVKWRMPVSW